MKKLISILLVVVFCYHWVGFWLTFKYRQYHLKIAKWEAIDSNDSTHLSITLIKLSLQEQQSNPHFRWEEQGREFVYYNKWYDVVQTKVVNDTTYFYCERDIDEEIFVNSFKNNQRKELQAQNTAVHKPLLIEGYCPESTYFSFVLLENQDKNFHFVLASHYQVFADIPSPPPKFS